MHLQFFEDFANWSYDEEEASGAGDAATPTLATWKYTPEHNLPRWGQDDPDRDLAAVGLPAELRFPVLVDRILRCKSCRRKEGHVQLLRHHPGACSAFEKRPSWYSRCRYSCGFKRTGRSKLPGLVCNTDECLYQTSSRF